MEGDDARAGGDDAVSQDTADQINQLLRGVAEDVGARADALAKRVDELEGQDLAAPDLRARLAELARMEEELSIEFETRLMDLDAMVLRRLAELRAGGDGAAAVASGVEVDNISAAEADLFDEDRSDLDS
jgi:uncharacterized protein YcaQ